MGNEPLQLPPLNTLPMCSFCKKNKATLLCDCVVAWRGRFAHPPKDLFYNEKAIEWWKKAINTPILCSNGICEDCATTVQGGDYCPKCIEVFKTAVPNRYRKKG